MIQTVQKTIKENKMKAKCVAVLVVVVIALGAVMAITGCGEKKKCTKAPETKAVEKAPAPAKK